VIASIFVYGTLRRGFGRHRVLQRLRARYAGEGTIEGELYRLGEFPGARKSSQASSRIVGEVYQPQNPKRAFRVQDLDRGLFRREPAEVSLQNGGRVTAWVYWLKRAPWLPTRIPSGDYARG